ncbi:hypothetical protein CK203_004466 [Vitis vinifera]|uniref:Retrovirus-related Pol polyprotein from transposon RE2 n=1 Tax=Vitis vinifera TaxID=29760 RepID=A0A438KFG9_VITVI|nr:hypothetical protein CK203_004466 [Vitis vinifera]
MNAATTLDLSNAYANYVSNQKVEGNNGQNTSGRGRGPGLNNSKEARVDVDEASAFIATSELVSDQSWYADSGAANHVIAELGNLSMKSDYHDENKLAVGNGNKLSITHVGPTEIPFLSSQDKENHQVLLQGKLEDGLYKLHIPETKNHTKSTVNSSMNPSVNPIVGLNLVE